MKNLVEGYRSYLPPHALSIREIARFATEKEIAQQLARLQAFPYAQLGKVCYVLGAGGQPKSTYVGLERIHGLRVEYYLTLLPPPLHLIPSYRGLVKIEDPSKLTYVFHALSTQSTAVLYFLDPRLEHDFAAAVQHPDKDHAADLAARDPAFLIYLVDANRDDSPTGMVDLLSVGKEGDWEILRLAS